MIHGVFHLEFGIGISEVYFWDQDLTATESRKLRVGTIQESLPKA